LVKNDEEIFNDNFCVEFKNNFLSSFHVKKKNEDCIFQDSFKWDEIPTNISCLIGLNGAGKTSLLKQINASISSLKKPNLFLSCNYSNFDTVIQNQELNFTLDEFKRFKDKKSFNDLNGYEKTFKDVFRDFIYEKTNDFSLLFYFDYLLLLKFDIENDLNKYLKDAKISNAFSYMFSKEKAEERRKIQQEFIKNCRDTPNFNANTYMNRKQIEDFFVEEKIKLSTGENLILLILLWKFHAELLEKQNNDNRPIKIKTRLLLLDEPDSHMHPSLIKDFLDLISGNDLKYLRLQVILTTHNPVTVELMNFQNNIFLLSKSIEAASTNQYKFRIELIQNKHQAISFLTSQLISIETPFIVVHVEDEDDVVYLKHVNNQLKAKFNLIANIKFEFTPTRGCGDILSIVEKLSKRGHKKVKNIICGIVDNDNKYTTNENSDEVLKYCVYKNSGKYFHLLRHSLENYVLDPFSFCLYLKLLSRTENRKECLEKVKSVELLNFAKFDSTKDFESLEVDQRNEIVQDIVKYVAQELIKFLCDPVSRDKSYYRIFKDSEELQTSKMLLFYFYKVEPDFDCEKFINNLPDVELNLNKKDLGNQFELRETDNLLKESKQIYSKLLKLKNEANKFESLIEHIKEYLNEPIKCKTAQTEDEYLEYPRILYVLRGHYLEYALYCIFFKHDEEFNFDKFKKGIILKDMLNNVQNIEFLIPNEIKFIFNKLDQDKFNLDIDLKQFCFMPSNVFKLNNKDMFNNYVNDLNMSTNKEEFVNQSIEADFNEFYAKIQSFELKNGDHSIEDIRMNNIKEKIKVLNKYPNDKFEVEHYLIDKTLKIMYPRYFFDISENDLKFIYKSFFKIEIADNSSIKFLKLNYKQIAIPIYLFDYISKFNEQIKESQAKRKAKNETEIINDIIKKIKLDQKQSIRIEELEIYRDSLTTSSISSKKENIKLVQTEKKDFVQNEFVLMQFYSSPINLFYFLLDKKIDNGNYAFLTEIKQTLDDFWVSLNETENKLKSYAAKSFEIIIENFFKKHILKADILDLIQNYKTGLNKPNQINKSKTLEEKLKTKNDAKPVDINHSLIDFENFTSEKRNKEENFDVKYPTILLQLDNEELNILYKCLFGNYYNSNELISFSKNNFLKKLGTSIPTNLIQSLQNAIKSKTNKNN
jgi:ABC-type polar amino acid transport system ATPase subunit